jgi:hypothetical protein
MRKTDTLLASLLWIAVATLLPLAALEPVAAVVPDAPAPQTAAVCADGSPHLAMGCAAVML